MGWIEKERHLSVEEFPIHGLFFLDGDVLARFLALKYAHVESLPFDPNWVKGQKFPRVEFPSGETFDVWENNSQAEATIHLFGEMDLSYRSTRDEALSQAREIAELCGYAVRRRGETQIDVWGEEKDERYTLTYDNEQRRMVNAERLTERVQTPVHPGHVLMNDEIRASLPPLYTNEKKGLEALAPVKYFTPDSHWTWYASEFDGQDIFFGLVSGNEVELGYFSLAELQSVRGSFELPIERDLHYEPKTLRELRELHLKERDDR